MKLCVFLNGRKVQFLQFEVRFSGFESFTSPKLSLCDVERHKKGVSWSLTTGRQHKIYYQRLTREC